MSEQKRVDKSNWLRSLPKGSMEIELPEGGTIEIRLFSKKEVDEIREACKVKDEVDTPTFERLLVQRGIADPALTDEDMTELEASGAMYYFLLNEIMDANGLSASANRLMRRSFRPGS